jgi:hypothetical protein
MKMSWIVLWKSTRMPVLTKVTIIRIIRVDGLTVKSQLPLNHLDLNSSTLGMWLDHSSMTLRMGRSFLGHD